MKWSASRQGAQGRFFWFFRKNRKLVTKGGFCGTKAAAPRPGRRFLCARGPKMGVSGPEWRNFVRCGPKNSVPEPEWRIPWSRWPKIGVSGPEWRNCVRCGPKNSVPGPEWRIPWSRGPKIGVSGPEQRPLLLQPVLDITALCRHPQYVIVYSFIFM